MHKKKYIMTNIKISTPKLKINSTVNSVINDTEIEASHEFTMLKFGQINPITVRLVGNSYEIIDGVARWRVAQKYPKQFPDILCQIIEISDEKVLDTRLILNSVKRKSIREKCLEIEAILDVLGKRQGVKRQELGFDENGINERFSENTKKDRYHWACHILNIKLSPSTVRKILFIFNLNTDFSNQLLSFIDERKISIDKAYTLLLEKNKKQEVLKMGNSINNGGNSMVSFSIFRKNSLNMDEVQDNSVRMVINSHPYFQLRKYRNQDTSIHGQESTVEEYIENFIRHCREARKKLVENGVLVTIIGETYKNGYQSVCTKVEMALLNDGWKIIDNNIWAKTNPKCTPHQNRFINAVERIIVASKSDKSPIFNPIKRPSSTGGKFKISKSTSSKLGITNYTVASPESDITNLIQTAVFNTSELKKIDSKFSHDAPAPEMIYEIFIRAYSNPGDTVLDNFSGSGTVSVGLKHGRNIIGYDVDPISVEFATKRCEAVINATENQLGMAA